MPKIISTQNAAGHLVEEQRKANNGTPIERALAAPITDFQVYYIADPRTRITTAYITGLLRSLANRDESEREDIDEGMDAGSSADAAGRASATAQANQQTANLIILKAVPAPTQAINAAPAAAAAAGETTPLLQEPFLVDMSTVVTAYIVRQGVLITEKQGEDTVAKAFELSIDHETGFIITDQTTGLLNTNTEYYQNAVNKVITAVLVGANIHRDEGLLEKIGAQITEMTAVNTTLIGALGIATPVVLGQYGAGNGSAAAFLQWMWRTYPSTQPGQPHYWASQMMYWTTLIGGVGTNITWYATGPHYARKVVGMLGVLLPFMIGYIDSLITMFANPGLNDSDIGSGSNEPVPPLGEYQLVIVAMMMFGVFHLANMALFARSGKAQQILNRYNEYQSAKKLAHANHLSIAELEDVVLTNNEYRAQLFLQEAKRDLQIILAKFFAMGLNSIAFGFTPFQDLLGVYFNAVTVRALHLGLQIGTVNRILNLLLNDVLDFQNRFEFLRNPGMPKNARTISHRSLQAMVNENIRSAINLEGGNAEYLAARVVFRAMLADAQTIFQTNFFSTATLPKAVQLKLVAFLSARYTESKLTLEEFVQPRFLLVELTQFVMQNQAAIVSHRAHRGKELVEKTAVTVGLVAILTFSTIAYMASTVVASSESGKTLDLALGIFGAVCFALLEFNYLLILLAAVIATYVSSALMTKNQGIAKAIYGALILLAVGSGGGTARAFSYGLPDWPTALAWIGFISGDFGNLMGVLPVGNDMFIATQSGSLMWNEFLTWLPSFLGLNTQPTVEYGAKSTIANDVFFQTAILNAAAETVDQLVKLFDAGSELSTSEEQKTAFVEMMNEICEKVMQKQGNRFEASESRVITYYDDYLDRQGTGFFSKISKVGDDRGRKAPNFGDAGVVKLLSETKRVMPAARR